MRAACVTAAVLMGAIVLAQNPSAALNLVATTANVSGAPDAVRIEILRWSTDEERDRLMDAWELKSAPSAGPGAGKGAAKAGAAKGAAKAGAGKAGAAGRGGAKGTGAAPALTPEAALEQALQGAATVGYLWSSETAGYALRYAGQSKNPDGSQRIILITQRRLGAVNQMWTPAGNTAPNDHRFSVIELHLSAKGEGEGKASLSGKIAPDAAMKVVSVENYEAQPVVFRDVRTRVAHP